MVKTKTKVIKEATEKTKKLTAPLFNQKGDKIGQVSLNKDIFGNKVNEDLLAQAIRIYLVNQRKGTASVKTKSEVSGGGRKPWRQKGLGKARAGSIRSPIWRGGGVTHGPKPKTYELTLPKKMKNKALLSALSDKAAENEIIVLDRLKFPEPKTKKAAELLKKLPKKRKILLVIEEKNETIQKSIRNIPDVKLQILPSLNTYEVVDSSSLILTKNSLEKMSDLYLKGEKDGSK